uniref:Uncharacterized protein n=1 Tax=Aegilops tauschii subsp. strangulata TaxID=200361 RepID=A0A453FH17_AEGTS
MSVVFLSLGCVAIKMPNFPSFTLYIRFLSTTKHFQCQSWRISSMSQTQYQARRSTINHSSFRACVGGGSLRHFFLLTPVGTLRS